MLARPCCRAAPEIPGDETEPGRGDLRRGISWGDGFTHPGDQTVYIAPTNWRSPHALQPDAARMNDEHHRATARTQPTSPAHHVCCQACDLYTILYHSLCNPTQPPDRPDRPAHACCPAVRRQTPPPAPANALPLVLRRQTPRSSKQRTGIRLPRDAAFSPTSRLLTAHGVSITCVTSGYR